MTDTHGQPADLYSALHALLGDKPSGAGEIVIKYGGAYIRQLCSRCKGRGHFYSAGTCYTCRGDKTVLRHVSDPVYVHGALSTEKPA